MHTFSIEKDAFYLDGAPFRVLAGTIHYFRVPREYWRDRLLKLKHCGVNAVETYVAWNAHMPAEDAFVTDGMLDLSAYLSLAQELGLWAIVRPGPYICAEWEAGALPWWLLREDMPLRCADPKYLAKVEERYGVKFPHNAARHSFISYDVALREDIGNTATVAGTSVAMIERHYKRVVAHDEAVAYFAVTP